MSPSVVCSDLTRQDGVIAAVNVYMENSNLTAFCELNLVSEELKSLANNSHGFLDVSRLEIENTGRDQSCVIFIYLKSIFNSTNKVIRENKIDWHIFILERPLKITHNGYMHLRVIDDL